MDDFELAAIEQIVQSQIGIHSSRRIYDRTLRTPMNLVLDEAERQLSKKYIVYWVDGGPPELFVLPGFSVTPVVWSSRHTETVAFMRGLFVENAMSKVRSELSERACLKVIAEHSLRHGDSDFAVRAFLGSMVGKDIYRLDVSDSIPELETWPIGVAYMATWFFGLVHELGHSVSYSKDQVDKGLFSDETIQEALDTAIKSFPLPTEMERLRREVIRKAELQGSRHSLDIDHLRSEALADFFATNVLFQSIINILSEVKPAVFETPRTMTEMCLNYVQETTMMLNIISLIERCQATALIGSSLKRDRDSLAAMALHPSLLFFRMVSIRWSVAFGIASLLHNSESPSEEQVDHWYKIVNRVSDSFADVIKEVEGGLARAMRFLFFPQDYETDLMASFAVQVAQTNNAVAALAQSETQHFCELADSLGITGEALETLRDIAEGRETTTQAARRGTDGQLYIVPWIKGPGGSERPLGLETKYGHLVFVFVSQGDLYDTFFAASADALPAGYTLETTAVVVSSEDQLYQELASKMTAGKRFGVVLEGSDAFSRYMRELANNTIWPD